LQESGFISLLHYSVLKNITKKFGKKHGTKQDVTAPREFQASADDIKSKFNLYPPASLQLILGFLYILAACRTIQRL
jgi:hypothetical protein